MYQVNRDSTPKEDWHESRQTGYLVAYPDPQKDLRIRSPRTVGGIIYGLCRGYDGSIQGSNS